MRCCRYPPCGNAPNPADKGEKMIGVFKTRGKKNQKKFGMRKLPLHDMVFLYRRPQKLTDSFINKTGLGDPKIKEAVKVSLLQNYGLVIYDYDADRSAVPSSSPDEKTEGNPVVNVGGGGVGAVSSTNKEEG